MTPDQLAQIPEHQRQAVKDELEKVKPQNHLESQLWEGFYRDFGQIIMEEEKDD